MDILAELEALHAEIHQEDALPSKDLRRRFWPRVSRIKRMLAPDDEVIRVAAEIRDILYREKLGPVLSLSWLWLWLVSGIAAIAYYIWLVLQEGRVTGSLSHDYDLGALVAAVTFFLYPFGRLIAGKFLGIGFDGISRDIYFLPTLKINYESYLRAAPPVRMWFFFFAGYWTAVVMIAVGAIGYWVSGEWTGVAFGAILAFTETLGAIFGDKLGGKWGGELGHFNREVPIVRDWRANLARLDSDI